MPAPSTRPEVTHPEVIAVTEASVSLAFGVAAGGELVDAPARVRVGDRTLESEGPGTRHLRVEGLEPDTEYAVTIEAPAGAAAPDRYLPERIRTAPRAGDRPVATFATLNDLHFGEARMGGRISQDGEYGEESAEFPAVRDEDYELPYSEFMNTDAVAAINALGVDAAVIKGDIADTGRPEQFETAARVFAGFEMPHHAFLGNHDYLARREGLEVDGYAILGQPRAQRAVELGGWRLLLLETSVPGEHHGEYTGERLAWLERELEESRDRAAPTLLLMHHHPVVPEERDTYPNTIGLRPEHSLALFERLRAAPEVKGVLVGHTHRNRIRSYERAGPVPFIEVNNSKDYPGGFAHYRLYADGHFRQEVHRTASPRALHHATRCRDLFRGYYRRFAFGRLAERSYVSPR